MCLLLHISPPQVWSSYLHFHVLITASPLSFSLHAPTISVRDLLRTINEGRRLLFPNHFGGSGTQTAGLYFVLWQQLRFKLSSVFTITYFCCQCHVLYQNNIYMFQSSMYLAIEYIAQSSSLDALVANQKCPYSGHNMRRNEGMEMGIMLGMVEGKRRRCPRDRWMDGVKEMTPLRLPQGYQISQGM